MKATDGITAAVVGAVEVIIVILANRTEIGVAEGDVGGLAEGLAAGDAIDVVIDGSSEMAQVCLVGDGVGCGASLVGSREEVVAESYAQLSSRGTPVRGILILQGERRCGGNDMLEGGAVQAATAEGDEGIILLDVKARQPHAVLEGTGIECAHAGGQGDVGEGVAVVKGVGADGGDAAADGERGQLLAADEGIVADRGDAVADGDAGQIIPPGGIGAPDVVNGGVAIVVHRSAAADGQDGVAVAVVRCQFPCGIVAARAAGGVKGHFKARERGTTGEGDRVRRGASP